VFRYNQPLPDQPPPAQPPPPKIHVPAEYRRFLITLTVLSDRNSPFLVIRDIPAVGV
jgi:hypothetical protein